LRVIRSWVDIELMTRFDTASGLQVMPDRVEAGRMLAGALREYSGRSDVTVLGMPRGGVPVAAEVARALKAPLDVLIVRKLGAPGHEELAVGAIAEGGVRVVNRGLQRSLGLSDLDIERLAAREELELERRVQAYRCGHKPSNVQDRTVILVDDGVATGATMQAGLQALRAMGASQIIAAAPVGAPDATASLAHFADKVMVLEMPEWFRSVGEWYEDFRQIPDDEVRSVLAQHRKDRS
jgi:putative phosphoribosyl transferase